MAASGVAEGLREVELLGVGTGVCGGVAIRVATLPLAENLGGERAEQRGCWTDAGVRRTRLRTERVITRGGKSRGRARWPLQVL